MPEIDISENKPERERLCLSVCMHMKDSGRQEVNCRKDRKKEVWYAREWHLAGFFISNNT